MIEPFLLMSDELGTLYRDAFNKQRVVQEKGSRALSIRTSSRKCDKRKKGIRYFLKLKPFIVTEASNLVVEWKDVDYSLRCFKFCWHYIQTEEV